MSLEGTPFLFDDLAMLGRTRTTASQVCPLEHEVAINHLASPPSTVRRSSTRPHRYHLFCYGQMLYSASLLAIKRISFVRASRSEALLSMPHAVGRFGIRATLRAWGWRAVQSELGDGIS